MRRRHVASDVASRAFCQFVGHVPGGPGGAVLGARLRARGESHLHRGAGEGDVIMTSS